MPPTEPPFTLETSYSQAKEFDNPRSPFRFGTLHSLPILSARPTNLAHSLLCISYICPHTLVCQAYLHCEPLYMQLLLQDMRYAAVQDTGLFSPLPAPQLRDMFSVNMSRILQVIVTHNTSSCTVSRSKIIAVTSSRLPLQDSSRSPLFPELPRHPN